MRTMFIVMLVVCSFVAAAAEREQEIDAVFAEWSTTRTPGCAVCILRGDQPTFVRTYGMASLQHHAAITPRSVFGIQSTSKQFVAMAIVLLIQEGRLSFDDDVRKYVPELPDYGARITVRHLLEHSSGIRDIGILFQDQGLQPEYPHTDAAVLRLIVRQKALNHPPGAAQSYTNSGYFLLGVMIERITGGPVSAFMKQRIFDPLGMVHTQYRDDFDTVIRHGVTGYRRDAEGAWRVSGNAKDNVFTTIEDFVRWNANFSKPVVGGEEAIHWMTTWGKLNTGQTTEWGLGLSPLRYRGLEGIYFSGGGRDGTSLFARFPKENFALIVLCNGSLTFNAELLGQKVVDVALAEEIAAAEARPKPAPPPDPAPVPVPPQELQRHAGLWFTTHGGPGTRELRVVDGRLRVVLSPERSVDLVRLGDGRFRASGSTTEYRFANGRIYRTAPNDPEIVFERVDETKTTDVVELAGTFHNEEIEADMVFTARDGKLHYAPPNQERPDVLAPLFRDTFADGPLVFRFRRDDRGRVIGVTKHWDRVWVLDYVRRAHAE